MAELMGYIYAITNKVNGKQYVGQTTQGLEKRWNQHLRSVDTIDTVLYRAMRKYGIHNFSIRLLDTVPVSKLDDAEIEWIEKLDTYGKNGYNCSLGGAGGGFQTTHEQIIEITDLYKQGYTITEVSVIVGLSYVTVSQILHQMSDVDSDVVIRHPGEQPKPAVQIDIYSRKIVNIYRSLEAAARGVALVGADGISNCCRGKTASAAGYFWRYLDEIDYVDLLFEEYTGDFFTCKSPTYRPSNYSAIMHLWEKGLSGPRIAELVDCSVRSVYLSLQKMGVDTKNRKNKRERIIYSEDGDGIIGLYYDWFQARIDMQMSDDEIKRELKNPTPGHPYKIRYVGDIDLEKNLDFSIIEQARREVISG